MKRRIIVVVLMMLACLVSPVFGEEPMETLRKPIDRALSLLQDPQYQTEEKKLEQRELLWVLIREIFDFTEVSKRSLGRYWRTFTPEEKTAFTDIFAQLLGNTYLDKIQGEFHNEQVSYLSQQKDAKGRVIVKTKIVREDLEIPIDYKLFNNGELWKVYDVYVEGVSLVKNYRTQFNKILFKKTPRDLIQRLEQKVMDQKKKHETPKQSAFQGYTAMRLACGQIVVRHRSFIETNDGI